MDEVSAFSLCFRPLNLLFLGFGSSSSLPLREPNNFPGPIKDESLRLEGGFHNNDNIKTNSMMMPPVMTVNKDTLNTNASAKATIKKTIRVVETVVFTACSLNLLVSSKSRVTFVSYH